MRRPLAPLLLALAAGCAAAAPPPPKPHDAPRMDTTPAIVSPARWDYHPPGAATALAAAKVDGGGCVYTAEGGQRWSAAATKMAGSRLVCTGKAEVSAAVAAEDLSGAIRRGDGSWIFVGTSGALFEASGPLAPFTRIVPAPEPLARVTGAGAGVLATTLEGRLLRWEEATGWRPAVTAGPLLGERVFDVVVGDSGRALALGFPEALFQSDDGGATWAATGAPTVGARALGRTSSGALGVQGMFETLVWEPGATPAFTRGREKVHAQQAVLDVEVGRAAAAPAVLAGRAVLDVERYYEIVRPDNEGDPWLLARGRIEGRLETVPLPLSKTCGNVRLGARGKTVFVVCVQQDKGEIAAEVRRSTDAGTTWSEGLRLVTPDTDQINLGVSSDGSALIVGLCRSTGGACKPGAPLRIVAGGIPAADAGATDAGATDALRAVPASAPQLTGAALLPAFSLDGRSAYFLGRRGKDDRINLFVSHDGGETFSPRSLDSGNTQRVARRPRDEDDEPVDVESPEGFEIDETSSLRPGDDGTLGMLLLRSRGDWAYVLADDDGRVLQVSGPPVDPTDEEGRGQAALMSGSGRRVLAVPIAALDGGPVLWESLDGGATWDRQAAPQSFAREYDRGQPAIVCALGGCLVGETVTRVGWGGQGGDPGGGERAPDPPSPGTPHVETPIVCELGKAPWARIENAYGGLSYSVPIPGIHESMRGRAVWSVMTIDRRTGAIAATSAMLPESGEGEARVITRSMLGPKPAGQHLATAVSASQHEGFAAVRVAVPVDGKTKKLKAGAAMRNVEVAWENFLEGTSGRARIADAGPFEPKDVALGEPSSRHRSRGDANLLPDTLHASLISVSSRGIFVHPHARSRGVPAFFVDTRGRAQRYEPHAWPSASPVSGSLDLRVDASALAGRLFGVGLLRDGDGEWSALALARGPSENAPAAVTAMALLPARSSPQLMAYTTWSWSAKAPVGVTAVVADPAHRRAWAHFVGFRSDGTFLPADPAPTLLDLGARPRGCSAAERAAGPRVNVPFTFDNRALFPGARHPVIVREPKPKNALIASDAFVLVTSGAVLYGTPAAPCVGAWEAPAVGRTAAGAVLQGDLTHAWLFRFSYDVPKSAGKRADGADPVPSLEYRQMSCRYDPAARVPDAVWNEPGTSRP